MLTLAEFLLEKIGGDSMAEVARQPRALPGADRRRPPAPVAGGTARAGRPRRPSRGAAHDPATAEAGSGGRRLRPPMDVVLVGLPGSGKSAVGRRLAPSPRRDVRRPRRVDRARRRPARSPRSSTSDGEAAFRALERAAVERPRARPTRRRRCGGSIATGGGAVVDPRNRWALYRGRLPIWLDGRPGGPRPAPPPLARTSGRSSRARPDRRRSGTWAARASGSTRRRHRVERRRRGGGASSSAVDELLRRRAAARDGTMLLRADDEDRRPRHRRGDRGGRGRRRRCGGSRRGARSSSRSPARGPRVGERLADDLRGDGWPVETVLLPQGEAAKRLAVIEDGGARAGAAAGRAGRAARRGRRRRAGRRGRVPRRHLPAGRALDPRPDDARRPGRLVDRRQDRRRPARGQEPRRRVPPAGGDRDRRRRRSGRSPSASCGPRSARRSKMAALGDERAVRAPRGGRARRSPRGDASAFDERARSPRSSSARAWAKVEVVARRRARARRPRAAGSR